METPFHSALEDQHREANHPQQEGLIVKWSVFLGLMLLITLYITIGYIHAKKRIRKGLVPLAYHRVSCPNPMCPLAISPSPSPKGARVHHVLTRSLPSHSGLSRAPSWPASTRATPTRRPPTPTTAPATTSSTHRDTTCRICRPRLRCTIPALPGPRCTMDPRVVPSWPRPRTTRHHHLAPRRRRGTTPGRRTPSEVRGGRVAGTEGDRGLEVSGSLRELNGLAKRWLTS